MGVWLQLHGQWFVEWIELRLWVHSIDIFQISLQVLFQCLLRILKLVPISIQIAQYLINYLVCIHGLNLSFNIKVRMHWCWLLNIDFCFTFAHLIYISTFVTSSLLISFFLYLLLLLVVVVENVFFHYFLDWLISWG